MAQVYYPPNYGNDAEERRLRKLQLMIQLGNNISQAYLGGKGEERMRDLADLKIAQDTENKDLFRKVLGRTGAEINPNDILASDEERRGIQEPSSLETLKNSLLGVKTPVQEPPNQARTLLNVTPDNRMSVTIPPMNTVPRDTRVYSPDYQQYFKDDVPKTRAYAVPIRAELPEMNKPTLASEPERAVKADTPAAKAESIKQTFTGKAGWGDSAPEQYQNNLDQLQADLKNPNVDKQFAIAAYMERKRGMDNIYKRERSGHDDMWLSMGGGKGGTGKVEKWRKGSEVIALPYGTTPGDLPEKHPKLRNLGNKGWDPVNPTDALAREREKAMLIAQISKSKAAGEDVADLEAQLTALNYGDTTKAKIITAPNWNNAFGLQPYGRQDLMQTNTQKGQEYRAGVVYNVNGKMRLWDGEKFVEVPRNARLRKLGG